MRGKFCISNKSGIFAFVRKMFGVVIGPKYSGLFSFSPSRYGDGLFTSRKGDPEQGSDSVGSHRFFIGSMSKTCSK